MSNTAKCYDCGKTGEMLYSKPSPAPMNPMQSVALCKECEAKDEARKKK